MLLVCYYPKEKRTKKMAKMEGHLIIIWGPAGATGKQKE